MAPTPGLVVKEGYATRVDYPEGYDGGQQEGYGKVLEDSATGCRKWK